MSEDQVNTTEQNTSAPAQTGDANLSGLFAFKLGMSTVHQQTGEAIPVTVLKMGQWKVSQVKNQDKDGYTAVQVSYVSGKEKNTSKAEVAHLKKSEMKSAQFTREIREKNVENFSLGQQVSIESVKVGDTVKVTSKSKGRGFTGAMKRWNFAGGPASHGSKFHRRPGSAGTRTWPGYVMAGKRGPGHWGDETVTVRNVQIVDVNKELGLILVKGPVPGARNTLVKIVKQ